jgi:hypothetical protein
MRSLKCKKWEERRPDPWQKDKKLDNMCIDLRLLTLARKWHQGRGLLKGLLFFVHVTYTNACQVYKDTSAKDKPYCSLSSNQNTAHLITMIKLVSTKQVFVLISINKLYSILRIYFSKL